MVMSQKVKVLHLYPDSTVQTSKGKKKPEFPNMVLTTHGGKSMGLLLQQNPTFTESKPTVLRYFLCPPCVANARRTEASPNANGSAAAPKPPLECEGCLLTSPAPSPSLRDNGRMMLSQANDPFPLSCQVPMTLGEKHALGQSIDEEMQQAAQNAASRDDLGYDSKRSMFMLLMGLAVFFSLIFGFAMWNSLIFKGDSAVVAEEPVAEEPVAEVQQGVGPEEPVPQEPVPQEPTPKEPTTEEPTPGRGSPQPAGIGGPDGLLDGEVQPGRRFVYGTPIHEPAWRVTYG